MKVSIKILLFLVFSVSPAFSQATFEFLKLDACPRTSALAGSFVAGSEDPNIIFYNPAGIGTLKDTPVSFSFVKHILDVNMASLSASHEFEGIGRFGAAIQYINYGSFDQMTEDGTKTGTFGASDFAFTLAYSNQLDNNFFYGVSGKFIYSGIADRYSTALACDLGLLYLIPESQWSFGFSVLNWGGQLKAYYVTKEDLPLQIKLGAAKQFAGVPLKIYFAFSDLNEKKNNFWDRFSTFTFGGEIRLSKALKARIGYDNQSRKDMRIQSTAGLAGLSLGLGITAGNYIIDYSYSSMGMIGDIHRFGLSTSF